MRNLVETVRPLDDLARLKGYTLHYLICFLTEALKHLLKGCLPIQFLLAIEPRIVFKALALDNGLKEVACRNGQTPQRIPRADFRQLDREVIHPNAIHDVGEARERTSDRASDQQRE